MAHTPIAPLMSRILVVFAARAAFVAATLLASTLAGAVAVGDAAPPFTLPTAGADAVALQGLRGRVVYVDFWASWCGPCRRSFPWMNEMQQKYGPRGLTIVGVNVDKRRADAERFLRGATASARDRVKLLKLVWDFVGTEFGGRQLQYEMFYSAAQPIVNTRMLRSYDWDKAKTAVDRCLGEY